MASKLKPGDMPMSGAQAVALMTSTQPRESTSIERKLLAVKIDLQRIEANIDRIIRETKPLIDGLEDIAHSKRRRKR